jgi:hypothetical protein
MTDEEAHLVINAVKEVALHHREWGKDYIYISTKNEFVHKSRKEAQLEDDMMSDWFSL